MSTEEPSEIIVEVVRAQDEAQAPARERRDPNTCPRCSSHYRDDELRAELRVCRTCGHHFIVGALERIAQLADPGTFEEAAAGLRSADPARLRRPEAVPRAPRGRRQRDGPRRRDGRRPRGDRRPPLRARHDGVPVPRRLDGLGRRREVRPRRRPGARGLDAADLRGRPPAARACRRTSSR